MIKLGQDFCPTKAEKIIFMEPWPPGRETI